MSTTTSTAPPAVQMLNVQIDGVWLQFPKGTRVIEACSQAAKFIPRYCYHPKLSSPGNCRMCMVELGMPQMTPDRQRAPGRKAVHGRRWQAGDRLDSPPADFLCARRGGRHGDPDRFADGP